MSSISGWVCGVATALALLASPAALADPNCSGPHGAGTCQGLADSADGKGPQPREDQCSDETGEAKATCCPKPGAEFSDPVSVVSGRLFMAETDLVVKGVHPIELVRRYSSQSDYDSPLGYGWAFTYDVQLFDYTTSAQPEVVIRTSCGVRTRYALDQGSFVSPPGSRTTLTDLDPGFLLTYPGGRKIRFTEEGLVEAFEDSQGNRLVFDYDPSGPGADTYDLVGTSPYAADPTTPFVVAQQHRIRTISEVLADGNPTGRNVTFAYDANGRLATATSHDNRTVTYTPEVDGTTPTGNLAEVLGLEGITSTYEYTDPAPSNMEAVAQTPYMHNLTQITRGQGTTTWVSEYDRKDRVVEQRRGARKLEFTYADGQTTVDRTVVGDGAPYVVQTVYQYDADGLITSIEDALGQKRVFLRIPAGGPAAKTGLSHTVELRDAANKTLRRTVSTYDDNGFLASRTTYLDFVNGEIDPSGRTVTETEVWDPQGWLTSREIVQSDRPGEVFHTAFTFHTDSGGAITNIHQIKRQTAAGPPATFETTTLTYDPSNGRVSLIELPDGHKIARTYYPWNAGAGQAGLPHETYHLDGASQPDPHLRVAWDYDGASNLASITDARGVATPGDPDDFETVIGWDDHGRVASITNALDEVTTFWFTAPTFGAPPSDPESAPPGEHLSQVKREGGGAEQRQRFHHDGDGNLRLVERHDGTGWVTFRTLDWDSDDQLLVEVMPRNAGGPDEVTSYTYDVLGRASTITQVIEEGSPGLTTVTAFGYNIAGNRASVTAAAGSGVAALTTFSYDGLDRLLTVTQDPLGLALQTAFLYDAEGNVIEVEDPKEQATKYTYDPLSRLLSVEQPLGQTVSYTWDGRGRLDRLTNARGNVLKHIYHEWGPLEKVEHYPDSTAADAGTGNEDRTVSYGYDLVGNVSTVSDTEFDPNPLLYSITYDALNRADVTTVHYVPGNTITQDSRYDAFGNRDELDVTDGGVLYAHDWVFNALGRLGQATFPGSGTTLPGAPVNLGFQYYDNDDLREITHGNGAVTTYTYHANGLIDTITVEDSASAQLHKLDYTVDKRLNVTSIVEEVGGTALSPDWVYDYDDASRLIAAVSYPSVGAAPDLPSSDAFPYDDAGNRDDNPTADSPWKYNANNQIERSPELRYEFDPDGNLCKWVPESAAIASGCAAGDDHETRFSFDYTNRLRRIDRPDESVVTYRYDPFGRRLDKTVSGVTTWFVWDGYQLLGEYDDSGDRTVRYAYAGGFAPIQVAYPDGATGEDVHEVHVDHLDTPRMLTGSGEVAVWQSFHEAYGKAHIDSSAGIEFNIRFPGQYYDEESEAWETDGMGGGSFLTGSGLHYNRWRFMDAATARYSRLDPIGQAMVSNTYAYVRGNPTNMVDPSGLDPNREIGRMFTEIFDSATRHASEVAKEEYNQADTDATARQNAGELPIPSQPIPFDSEPEGKSAYRHCLAACEITRRHSRAAAQAAGDLNEVLFGDGIGSETNARDRAANRSGRSIGRSACSEEDCRAGCRAIAFLGGLGVAPKSSPVEIPIGQGARR